jgi:hypothetical protein
VRPAPLASHAATAAPALLLLYHCFTTRIPLRPAPPASHAATAAPALLLFYYCFATRIPLRPAPPASHAATAAPALLLLYSCFTTRKPLRPTPPASHAATAAPALLLLYSCFTPALLHANLCVPRHQLRTQRLQLPLRQPRRFVRYFELELQRDVRLAEEGVFLRITSLFSY